MSKTLAGRRILVTRPAAQAATLAAMIDVINRTKKVHILTLEEPIEYIHPHKMAMVNQREIGIDSNNYANALQSLLQAKYTALLSLKLLNFYQGQELTL